MFSEIPADAFESRHPADAFADPCRPQVTILGWTQKASIEEAGQPTPLPSTLEGAATAPLAEAHRDSAPELPSAAASPGSAPFAFAPPWLKGFAAFLLFSHVDRQGALMHPGRQMLVRLIEAQPGISLPAMRAASRMSRGNLTYHLLVLERNQVIHCRKVGRGHHYFAAAPKQGFERYALLQNDRRKAIAAFILANPQCNQREICAALGLPQSRVHAHVQALFETGLLERHKAGRAVTLQPSHALNGLALIQPMDPSQVAEFR